MKLTKLGKNLFIGIEGILFGITMICSFKYQIISLIAIILLGINGKFISDHSEA